MHSIIPFSISNTPSGVRAYTIVGTPEYIAPEVILAKGYEFICGPLPFGAGEDFDGDPQMELFRQILEAPLKFPSYVKETAAVHVLTNLLEKIPELRLGAAADKANEIKRHAYFEEIDFDPVAGGYMEPPWKPNKAALRAQWEKCEEDKISDKSSDFGDLDGMTTPERNKEKKKWEWCEEF